MWPGRFRWGIAVAQRSGRRLRTYPTPAPSRGCASGRSGHTLASCWSGCDDQRRIGTALLAPGMRVATRPQVVIVGGGFGGLACARALDGEPVDVLLIDGHNYHLFTPLLYQVATALLNPSDIVYPFRTIFRRSANVRFRQAFVTGVDMQARVVRTRDEERIPYDYLVLASGSTNNYYGHPELSRFTIGMKTIPEALRLRNHVLSCLELAAREGSIEEKRHCLTFVVVGGGPTGVEYSGALNELLKIVLGRDFPER